MWIYKGKSILTSTTALSNEMVSSGAEGRAGFIPTSPNFPHCLAQPPSDTAAVQTGQGGGLEAELHLGLQPTASNSTAGH